VHIHVHVRLLPSSMLGTNHNVAMFCGWKGNRNNL